MPVYIILYMGMGLERAYLRALGLLNLRALSDWTGRAYSTLMAYRQGARRVTPDAARELADYLRHQAQSLTEAADRLEAALAKEEGEDG